MKKRWKNKRWKILRHQLSAFRATMKKRSPNVRCRRQKHVQIRYADASNRKQHLQNNFANKIAPSNFSFINNTEEVINYLEECRKCLHHNENVSFDISDVTSLTPDAIALLVASVNDCKFLGKYGRVRGNAPRNEQLRKLLIESGFYDYVDASNIIKSLKNSANNLLHKECNVNVQSDLARNVCILGTQHVFNNNNPIPDLYEMLVEAMSNTNNHASKNKDNKVKWWLYIYNSPEGYTSYTFIDLGVGIFDSLPVQLYKKAKILIGLMDNVDLVPDLLEGKIKSSIKADNDIRGKGIPQIALNSQKEFFKQAYIISNDVKINLKNGHATKLNSEFKGTFLYWELSK